MQEKSFVYNKFKIKQAMKVHKYRRVFYPVEKNK